MIKLIIALTLVSGMATAASVKILSDGYPSNLSPKPTICKIFIDNDSGTDTPVVADPAGNPRCEWTSGQIQPGNHTSKARFAYMDNGKRVESVDSNTTNFTIAPPVTMSQPTGLRAIIIP